MAKFLTSSPAVCDNDAHPWSYLRVWDELHRYRPQTILATQKTKSATGKVLIGHRSISAQTFCKSAVIVMCITRKLYTAYTCGISVWSGGSLVRWRLTDLRVQQTACHETCGRVSAALSGRDRALDAVQPSQSQSFKDTAYALCYCTTSDTAE